MASAVLAGTIADIDWLSNYFGPSAFLSWHGTYAHSILAAVLVSAIFPAILLATVLKRGLGVAVPKGQAVSFDGHAMGVLIRGAFLVPLCAALLHIAMDACQSDGVALFWPFSPKRLETDWLPSIDPWILTILIACIAVPELLHLVTSEIGAKAIKPRGQTGAIVGLGMILIYVGVRATLHSNVLALMQSRTYHGETAQRTSAFPESLSVVTWHGVVETETALTEISANAASTDTFDPDVSMRLFKPEQSPALDAARNTAVAKRFLATAQIPKASLEKTEAGYVVVLRDLRYVATGETKREIAAVIELNANNKVTSQELVWARDLRR